MLSRCIKWVASPEAKYKKIPDSDSEDLEPLLPHSQDLEPPIPHSQDSKIVSPRLCHAPSLHSHPTHIGLALYLTETLLVPILWVVILSSSQDFNDTVWFGTVVESVNGWIRPWMKYENLSSPTYAPRLSGIIKVDTVNKKPSDIIAFISTLAWKPQHLRDCCGMYRHLNEYACQVLLHLCKEGIVTLPDEIKKQGFSTHIEERLSKMQEENPRKPRKIDTYPTIPIGKGDVDYVQTKV